MRLKFGKETEGGFSRPTTASVPVVVFMFLLFLMAATVMRETALNVKRAEGAPQSPRMTLHRTQDAAYAYLVSADASVNPRYRTREGYVLLFNDSYARMEQLEDFVKTEKGFAALKGRRNIAFRIKSDAQLDRRFQDSFKQRLDTVIARDTLHYKVR